MNWRRWLSEKGVELPAESGGMSVNSYPVLVDAASNGEGIALGWAHLVSDALAAGKLVNPIGAQVDTNHGYFVVTHSGRALPDDGVKFMDWIAAHCI